MRVKAVLVRVCTIVGFRRHVNHVCFAFSYTFPSVVHPSRNHHEAWIVLAHEDFIERPAGRRILAIVIQDGFYHALYTRKSVNLNSMIMPCFDYSRVHGSHVYLAEAVEKRVIPPHYFHEAAAFVGYNPKILN
jgi:hypothetical protein